MKAIQYQKYGGPEVLELVEIEKPKPTGDQVLVEIKSSSVNPMDWHIMRASPFFVRFTTGLFGPKNKNIGADMAGEVVELGPEVKNLQVGDRVFGDMFKYGYNGFSEYCTPSETGMIKMPDNVSYPEAGACGVAAITAYQALTKWIKVKEGDHILINGASGGVGTFAIQMAKALGCKVTAVGRTEKQEMLKSIGADRVIDYTKTDFAKEDIQYDHIFEIAFNKTLAEYKRLLKPNGIAQMVGALEFKARTFMKMMKRNLSRKENKRLQTATAQFDRDDFEAIAEMLASGKVKPVIGKTYPLEEVAKAIEELEEGHAYGKISIHIKD